MNIKTIKSEFPIFRLKTPNGKDLIYLDNASSTQKPQSVIDAITEYYSSFYSNTGRASYWPANEATRKVEACREKVAEFIGAESEEEIVFTAGTTDAINKLAQSYFSSNLWKGEQIIVSTMEHHANLIPWQEVARLHGLKVVAIPLTEKGGLDLAAFRELLLIPTALVAVTAISNVLGTINDIPVIARLAHDAGTKIFVDAAQLAPYDAINVRAMDCDFLSFSAHKIYGPTGVGVLYGKKNWLHELPPLTYGGGMITEVDVESSQFRESPFKHEAGTLNIAGILGLGAAIDFLKQIDLKQVKIHEDRLTLKALDGLASFKNIQILGSQTNRAPIVSFNVPEIHPHDLATVLNEYGICIRAGHHCAQPLMKHYNIPAACRISFGVYNEEREIEAFLNTLKEASSFFL